MDRLRISLLLHCLVFCVGGSGDNLTVRAVTYSSHISQHQLAAAHSDTHCDSSGTVNATVTGTYSNGRVSGTTSGTSNCRTSAVPAQYHNTLDVREIVEGKGSRYVIACTAHTRFSACDRLIDGDLFPAEVEGSTMWIEAHKGGNQGKRVRIKYKILDIRPISSSSPSQ